MKEMSYMMYYLSSNGRVFEFIFLTLVLLCWVWVDICHRISRLWHDVKIVAPKFVAHYLFSDVRNKNTF